MNQQRFAACAAVRRMMNRVEEARMTRDTGALHGKALCQHSTEREAS